MTWLVWQHRNGRVYRRRLKPPRYEFVVPANALKLRVEAPPVANKEVVIGADQQ